MRSLAERFSLLQRFVPYLDPLQPKRIGRGGWIAFAVLLILAVLPSLWAPFDGDQALFFVSGEKILKGDILYRDIVDLKPPLIYFIYAGAVGIFGKSVIAIRLVELLVQAGVIWLIVRTVRRVSGNDAWSLLSGCVYAALYFSLPFYCRGQVEGFAALPIAAIFALLVGRLRNRTAWSLPLIGVMIGLLLLLKTSFLAVLPLVALFLLFDSDVSWKKWMGRTFMTSLGIIPPIMIAFLYLWWGNALGDFSMMQEFTKGYAAAQWGSFMTPITLAIREIPWYFVTTWSLSLSLFTLGGLYLVLFPLRSAEQLDLVRSEQWKNPNPATFLLYLSLAAFLLLLATVAVEAKYLAWHFNRLFVPGALLAGWGCLHLVRRVLIAPMNAFTLGVVILCIPVAVLFSPSIRYAWNNAAFLTGAVKGTEGFSQFIGMEDDAFDMRELEQVGNYIRTHREQGGRVFTASGWGGSIHFYAGDVPDFKLYHSCYLIAPYAPEEWRRQTVRYLLEEQPQFIVAQRDAMPHITGVDTTSLAMLHALPGIDSLLQTRYRVAMDTKMTVVYELVDGR